MTLAVFAASFLVRMLLEPILKETAPFILSTLSVMVSAWYGGFGPGLLATALGAVSGTFLFLDPGFPIVRLHSHEIVELLLFLVVGVVISWLNEALHSARNRAEQSAQEATAAQQRTNDILASIGDAFRAFDRQWRYTYVNDRAALLVRKSREELIGNVLWEVFPGVPDRVRQELERAVAEQTPVHFEQYYAVFDAWLEVDAYPGKDGISVFSRDISERKRAEEARAQLAAIVESSADAIISTDLNGLMLSWNAGAQRMYGYPGGEAIGRPFSMLLPPGTVPDLADALERLRRGERVVDHETVHVTRNGAEVQVSLTLSPIKDHEGRVIRTAAIARDITRRKEMEEQFRQTQKLESLGVLAGGIAHDFNNLLTGIMGNTTLALEDLPSHSGLRGPLESVVRASERAAHLTRQMLAYSGKGRFITEAVDLSRSVTEIESLLASSIGKSVDLRLELADAVPSIEADPSQMQQVIMNLVMNAAEALEEDSGTVLVRTAVEDVDENYIRNMSAPNEMTPGQYVILEVHDTGCGMDEATLEKIFDPFFTTKFMGRGLGLPAVLGIVRGHKGGLKVYSHPGQGSVFKVLFPVRTSGAAPRLLAPAGEFFGSGLILVVDDEEIVRRTARAALERYGYTVLLASNGREAIETLAKQRDEISLVLLDMTMPVMNGEEAIQHLKEIRPDVPVIASSGYNEVIAIRRFTGKPLSGFIQKPYSSAELARSVKTVLDEARRVHVHRSSG